MQHCCERWLSRDFAQKRYFFSFEWERAASSVRAPPRGGGESAVRSGEESRPIDPQEFDQRAIVLPAGLPRFLRDSRGRAAFWQELARPHQGFGVCQYGERGSVGNAKLAIDVVQVHFHGPLGESKPLRYFLVG